MGDPSIHVVRVRREVLGCLMVVCPQCGYPQQGTFGIIAERDTSCQRCDWTGLSSDLIAVPDGKFADPKSFDELYKFLQEKISPQVGRKMVELGLVKQIDTGRMTPAEAKEHLKVFTELLIGYSRAGFESILRGVLERDGTGS